MSLLNNKLAEIELAPHQLFSFWFALRPFSHKSNWTLASIYNLNGGSIWEENTFVHYKFMR